MTATRKWTPGADGCEVYNAAFGVPVALAFGVYDGQTYWMAGYVPFDSFTPDKRGLVFDTHKLQTGMEVFIQLTDGSFKVYDVTVVNGIDYCNEHGVQPTPIPSPTLHPECVSGDIAASRSSDGTKIFAEASCDPPHMRVLVNGEVVFDSDFDGSTLFRVKPSDTVEVDILGNNGTLEHSYIFTPKS
ncbi:MAG TPA: hypothetical protein VG895_01595 [Patescibacteria group bacterium]|nr:hypothetical protein [Patescibacteria group bacterium]